MAVAAVVAVAGRFLVFGPDDKLLDYHENHPLCLNQYLQQMVDL